MTSSEIPLTAKAVSNAGLTRTRPAPISFACNRDLKFSYTSSADGVDTNLLILLHGRGDNEKAFAKLGQSLELPQTATLAIQGPLVVPLLDDHEREWWPETDYMGMDVSNPDPSKAAALLIGVLNELTAHGDGSWRLSDIHLFGFGQGGSLAMETGRELTRRSASSASADALGSIVSIQGPLLSLPMTGSIQSSTKVMYVMRPIVANARSTSEYTALRRGYSNVQTVALQGIDGIHSHAPCMPRNKSEWSSIMEFWSKELKRRSAWEFDGDLLEITGGQQSVPLPSRSPAPAHPANVKASEIPPAQHKIPQDRPNSSNKGGLKRGFLSKGLG